MLIKQQEPRSSDKLKFFSLYKPDRSYAYPWWVALPPQRPLGFLKGPLVQLIQCNSTKVFSRTNLTVGTSFFTFGHFS